MMRPINLAGPVLPGDLHPFTETTLLPVALIRMTLPTGDHPDRPGTTSCGRVLHVYPAWPFLTRPGTPPTCALAVPPPPSPPLALLIVFSLFFHRTSRP